MKLFHTRADEKYHTSWIDDVDPEPYVMVKKPKRSKAVRARSPVVDIFESANSGDDVFMLEQLYQPTKSVKDTCPSVVVDDEQGVECGTEISHEQNFPKTGPDIDECSPELSAIHDNGDTCPTFELDSD